MPNSYSPLMLDLLGDLRDGELALDSGSGGRPRPHPRCVQLEYVTHPLVDVVGDGQALPFRDDAFSVVISQATIEHVPRPQDYVNEVFRVLRPGGMLYVEVAFIQPVHMEPNHYFNVTPHGLRYLCRAFEIAWTGTCGFTFDGTIDWLCREAGVPTPRLRTKTIAPERLERVASGVCLLARKPSTPESHEVDDDVHVAGQVELEAAVQ